MSNRLASLRSFGFWVGPVLLAGSLLLGGLVAMGAAYLPPLAVLLLLPAGGLLLGGVLILGARSRSGPSSWPCFRRCSRPSC